MQAMVISTIEAVAGKNAIGIDSANISDAIQLKHKVAAIAPRLAVSATTLASNVTPNSITVGLLE
jgi:hypothetical protein